MTPLSSGTHLGIVRGSFLHGRFGTDMCTSIFFAMAPARKWRLDSSGPLSQCILGGLPDCATALSSMRVVRQLEASLLQRMTLFGDAVDHPERGACARMQ